MANIIVWNLFCFSVIMPLVHKAVHEEMAYRVQHGQSPLNTFEMNWNAG